MVEMKIVDIEKDNDTQVFIGHAGFIKTVEDLYETMVGTVPGISFGLAFVEASGPCLVRSEGNDAELKKLAEKNAMAIGAGHAFIIMFKNAYPINLSNAIKNVHEITNIFCATANPVQVIIAETAQGRGVMGVIDGSSAKGLESAKEKTKRKKLLRDLGYKM